MPGNIMMLRRTGRTDIDKLLWMAVSHSLLKIKANQVKATSTDIFKEKRPAAGPQMVQVS